MTWNALAIVGSCGPRTAAETPFASGARNLTIPLVPSATVVCVLPFWFVILVLDATANVSVWPFSLLWKLECVTVIVIEPSVVPAAAVKLENVPLSTYITLGAALLWLVCVAGGFASATLVGIASATATKTMSFLIWVFLSLPGALESASEPFPEDVKYNAVSCKPSVNRLPAASALIPIPVGYLPAMLRAGGQ